MCVLAVLKALAESVRSEVAKARATSSAQLLPYLAQVVDKHIARANSTEDFKRHTQDMKKKVGSNLLRL